MAERTLLTESIQIGIETTPGTAVAATKKLLSAIIDFSPDGEMDAFRPSGSKFPAISSIGKEWSGGDLEGKPTYDELMYWFSLMLGAPTTTTPGGATNARQHVWPINALAVQNPKTATLERGSSVRAMRVPHFYLNALGLEYSRSEINLSGEVMAQQIQDGFTLTGGTTDLPLVPVLPKDTSIYLDTTLVGIGSTKLLRAIEADWNLGDKFGQVWPINAALDSFAAIYETEPDAEVNLTLEADASGMAPLTQVRNGDIRYLRFETIGGEIETGQDFSLLCDFAVRAKDFPEFGDEDDLMTIEYPFGMFIDPDWGSGQVGEITLTNQTAAL